MKYSGQRGIEQILKLLSQENEYIPQLNESHIIALNGNESSITLEPGSQIELSGKQHDSVHSIKNETENHFRSLLEISKDLNILFINTALQPLSELDEIELIPKQRYSIMYPYMDKVGTLGHRMMKQSSAIQISIDYSDESDAIIKFKTAMGIVPICYSIFANSPILGGKLNGYKSYRGHVWTNTDPDRCGILPFAFDDNFSFNSYVDYALDAGMYFVERGGQLHNMTGVTFAHFLKNGHNGFTATQQDWELHISTLFPEVRLKKYIEIRCFDSQPYENMLAVPAMIKGIFYDTECLDAAWELVKDWSWEERLQTYNSVHKYALQAEVRGKSFQELAIKLINIAKNGLLKQNNLNKNGENETIYLHSIEQDVRNGICPADKLIQKWENEWNRDIKKLINYCAYNI